MFKTDVEYVRYVLERIAEEEKVDAFDMTIACWLDSEEGLLLGMCDAYADKHGIEKYEE